VPNLPRRFLFSTQKVSLVILMSDSALTEVLALQGRDSAALNALRSDKDSALFPDKPWEELISNTDVLQGLYDQEFDAPSHIQCQSIPVLGSDPPRSLLAQAPSGSGKTTAFLTAMLMRVDPHIKRLQAICLGNTLELVQQTFRVAEEANKHTRFALGWTAGTEFVGGGDVQVLIGTPAGVNTAISEGRRGIDASAVRILILDEADELLKKPAAPRKGEQSKASFFGTIERLVKKRLPPNTSIGFFSATFSDDTRAVIREWRPGLVEVEKQEVPKQIRHFYFVASDPLVNCVELIVQIAGRQFVSQGIVFVPRKEQAKPVADMLTGREMKSRWVTGDTNRPERLTTLADFRGLKFKFLATTNMYARGIDIPEVFLVVQVGISAHSRDSVRPNVIEYQHRAGRAGRFGRAGVSISVITEKEIPLINDIAKQLCIDIDRLTPENLARLPTDAQD
jgi:ATP-dependent RNA helicase DDX19/DBP5